MAISPDQIKVDIDELRVCFFCGAVFHKDYIHMNDRGNGICPACKNELTGLFKE